MAAWHDDMGTFMRAIYEQQISGRVPAADSPFSIVIDRCLQPRPDERYSDFRELRKDLEAIFERRTNQRLHALRDPRRDAAQRFGHKYSQQQILLPTERIAPLAAPGSILVSDLMP